MTSGAPENGGVPDGWDRPREVQHSVAVRSSRAPVAQGTERRTSNPRVGGSNPPGRILPATHEPSRREAAATFVGLAQGGGGAPRARRGRGVCGSRHGEGWLPACEQGGSCKWEETP